MKLTEPYRKQAALPGDYVTEEYAEGSKYCPLMAISLVILHAPEKDGVLDAANCEGTLCMMWRSRPHGGTEADGYAGYCGLAGPPT